ncbi:hypothetical protein Tco_0612398 [Tanacetum coccineum]
MTGGASCSSLREQGNVPLQCPKLTDANYTTWALMMETILNGIWTLESIGNYRVYITKKLLINIGKNKNKLEIMLDAIMANVPPFQSLPYPQGIYDYAQQNAGDVSPRQPEKETATLLIRHLPKAIPQDTLTRLFSHYGASCVRNTLREGNDVVSSRDGAAAAKDSKQYPMMYSSLGRYKIAFSKTEAADYMEKVRGAVRNYLIINIIWDLLIENKELTAGTKELREALPVTQETIKREEAGHFMVVFEVKKRPDNLRKAIDFEKRCRADHLVRQSLFRMGISECDSYNTFFTVSPAILNWLRDKALERKTSEIAWFGARGLSFYLTLSFTNLVKRCYPTITKCADKGLLNEMSYDPGVLVVLESIFTFDPSIPLNYLFKGFENEVLIIQGMKDPIFDSKTKVSVVKQHFNEILIKELDAELEYKQDMTTKTRVDETSTNKIFLRTKSESVIDSLVVNSCIPKDQKFPSSGNVKNQRTVL